MTTLERWSVRLQIRIIKHRIAYHEKHFEAFKPAETEQLRVRVKQLTESLMPTVWVVSKVHRGGCEDVVGACATQLEALEYAVMIDPSHDIWQIEHMRVGGFGLISSHGYRNMTHLSRLAELRQQARRKGL